MCNSIKLIAPAKVNLNLLIINKLNNGYHNLESDLCFLNLYDEILIEKSKSNKIIIDNKKSNFFLKKDTLLKNTLNVFNDAFQNKENFKITLKKNIPLGAGLGGGSADSAALLLGLRFFHNKNILNNKKISIDNLKLVGLKIGSDVPACILSESQRLRGIGNNLTNIQIPDDYKFLIIFPNSSLSTKKVFENYDNLNNHKPEVSYFENIKIFNTLLHSAQELEPKIYDILKLLKSFKKIIAFGMSGSGSSCFGIFENEEDLIKDEIYDRIILKNDLFIWHGDKKEFGYNRILL